MKRWMLTAAAIGAMTLPALAQQQGAQVYVRTPPGGADQRTLSVLLDPAPAVPHGKATWLGVVTSPAAPAVRAQLKLPAGVALAVDSVEPKSPADAAGVKPRDLLEKLDDQWLINAEQLTALLRNLKPGKEVTLSIIRKGERMSIKARLGEKEVGRVVPTFGVPTYTDIDNTFQLPALGFDPAGGGEDVIVNNFNGRLTTNWSDDEFSITVERGGGKAASVNVKDAKTGKVLYTGAPPEADNPIFKSLPHLANKLKHAHAAAAGPANVTFFLNAAMMPGARGKVMRWQDADHLLFMRVMGGKPVYLLALSKKDGRTFYDGPVKTDEERRSIPAEVREQFDLLVRHPDDAKEFGAADTKAKK